MSIFFDVMLDNICLFLCALFSLLPLCVLPYINSVTQLCSLRLHPHSETLSYIITALFCRNITAMDTRAKVFNNKNVKIKHLKIGKIKYKECVLVKIFVIKKKLPSFNFYIVIQVYLNRIKWSN